MGYSSMVVGIRVLSQNIQTGEEKHCNSSYFSMMAKDTNEVNCKVPGLILSDKNDLRRFLRSIEHINHRNDRKTEFSENNFMPENHKSNLEGYNVKIQF